jgi:hypothetical protein
LRPDTLLRINPRRLRSIVLLLVLAVVVCAVALAVAVAAEILRIESAWSAETPEIDGKLAEWSSPLVTLGSTPLSRVATTARGRRAGVQRSGHA